MPPMCSAPSSAGRLRTSSHRSKTRRGRTGIEADLSVSERVLLIEDDSRLAGMVREYLGKAGYHVIHAENGTRGLALHGREPVDAVILDLMLPDADGLEGGADDYLPNPFEPRELLARLRAILRRGRAGAKADVLRFGRLEIDRGAREVRLDGSARTLTGYQFALLLA